MEFSMYQTPATRKICTRRDAYINKINKILAVFFRLKYIILKTKSSDFSRLKYMRVVPIVTTSHNTCDGQSSREEQSMGQY